jgi:heme/copper-type cytochrome/quinol oxidase subunit 2
VIDTRSEHDNLAGLYLPIGIAVAGVIVVLVIGLSLWYRFGPAGDGDGPRGPSHAPRVEFVYVLLLAAAAAILLGRSLTVEARVDPVRASNLTIDVTAGKWQWRFDYPQSGIVQRGTDTRDPLLVVPTGQEVLFRLRSRDVVHAFWIPYLRYKRDATPGRTELFTLLFERLGRVPGGGACTEFCGLGHWTMRFNVLALRPEAFEAWVARRRTEP